MCQSGHYRQNQKKSSGFGSGAKGRPIEGVGPDTLETEAARSRAETLGQSLAAESLEGQRRPPDRQAFPPVGDGRKPTCPGGGIAINPPTGRVAAASPSAAQGQIDDGRERGTGWTSEGLNSFPTNRRHGAAEVPFPGVGLDASVQAFDAAEMVRRRATAPASSWAFEHPGERSPAAGPDVRPR